MAGAVKSGCLIVEERDPRVPDCDLQGRENQHLGLNRAGKRNLIKGF